MTIYEFAPRVRQRTPAVRPSEPSAQAFDVDVEPDRERVIVVPRGDLDLATVDRLGACIDGLVDAGFDTFVLDLRRLTFLDSTGLCLIVRESRRPELTIRVIDGPEGVARLFDLTRTREVLSFMDPHELRFRR